MPRRAPSRLLGLRSGCGARGRVRPRAVICKDLLLRRGALPRRPGALLRRAAAARHRARPVSRARRAAARFAALPHQRRRVLVGDFELNYRMHHRAGRAIKAVLEGAVDEAVRNEAAFRLARIHFQKDQLDDALHALERIEGEVPEAISGRRRVPARERLHGARPARATRSKCSSRLQSAGEPDRVSPRTTSASRCCRTAGRRMRSSSSTAPGESRAASARAAAIRDKSNLVLGTMLFESADFTRAEQSLDRVRLEGPFSNQALLRAGWAEVSAEQLRPRARAVEHPGRARADGRRRAGSDARRAACVRQARTCTAARRSCTGARSRPYSQRDRQGRRLDRQHPRRASSSRR